MLVVLIVGRWKQVDPEAMFLRQSGLIYDFQASEKPVSKEVDCIPENYSQGYPVDTHTYTHTHMHSHMDSIEQINTNT